MPFNPQKLAFLRSKHGYTYKQLSHMTGISLSHLNAMEKGTRPGPSFNNVERLAKTFAVPITYFSEETVAESAVDYRTTSADEELTQLYDAQTLKFLRDKEGKPYIEFALQLASLNTKDDSATILSCVAEFMNTRKREKLS